MSQSTQQQHPLPARRPEDALADEERFALVSVLQELTVAALELFDPRKPADTFLERLAERLGCYATALFGMAADGRSVLEGASGLSPRSRMLPISLEATRAMVSGDGSHSLPYPELADRELVTWRFPVLTPPGAVLFLFFDGEPQLPARYRGMLRRLTDILGRVLEHRGLFARSIESQRRLDEKKSIIECLSEASPDGVLFLDHAGEVFFFNRHFVDMWGLETVVASRSRDEIMSAAATRVTDPEQFLRCLAKLDEHGDCETHDELQLKDGRVYERQVLRVKSNEGVFHGYALFFRDITERKRAESERESLLETERAARAAAEEAIRARDDFLSIASHELRTPLASLLLATEQVTRAARDERIVLPAATIRALEMPRRQAERLVRLVDALLDVSSIQAGRLELEREDIDLGEVVRDVIARFQQDLERAHSELQMRVEGDVRGMWDRSRIDQVVTNLISNAIKYGRGNLIDVTITGADDTVRLALHDRGIGIDPEQTGRLFQRFERAVSSRHYGGLGLGLFIVRQIVEMHGGTVDVASEPNVGSTFTVLLPRRPS
jgi:PAS domain S-box-containing protein